jgi:hypothetical protein
VHNTDLLAFLPRLLSSGRAVKHFAEINTGNRLRVSDYLASTFAREKLRASASVANCCVHDGPRLPSVLTLAAVVWENFHDQ